MGIPAQFCLGAFGTPSLNDQATGVISGQFSGPGLSPIFSFYGSTNFSIFCSAQDTLTTTAGSFTATVSGATSGLIAAGTSILPSINTIPNGAVFSAFTAGSGTIAYPPFFITAKTEAGSNIIKGNFPTNGYVTGTTIIGSTISGFGIPSATTVTSIINASNQTFGYNTPNPNEAVISLSNAVTASPRFPTQAKLQLVISANLIPSSSATAFFSGSTIAYTGSVQLEKSFDGGANWLVANIGPPGSGSQAIFQNAACVSFSLYEPEKGVLYRWNCTSFTPVGTEFINYRISATGSLDLTSSST